MESVAPDAFVVERARQAVGVGDEIAAAMEAGVETGDLLRVRKQRRGGAHAGEIVRLVQRRQRLQAFERGHRLGVDEDGLGEGHAAVDDAMADGGDRQSRRRHRRQRDLERRLGVAAFAGVKRALDRRSRRRPEMQLGVRTQMLDLPATALQKAVAGLEHREFQR